MKILLLLLVVVSINIVSGIRFSNRLVSGHSSGVSVDDTNFNEISRPCDYRGGYTKKSTSKKNQLTTGFMLKSFFVSLYDPTVGGLVDNSGVGHVTQAKIKGNKKQGSSFGGMFGSFGAGGSSGNFGPVCGPNGCH